MAKSPFVKRPPPQKKFGPQRPSDGSSTASRMSMGRDHHVARMSPEDFHRSLDHKHGHDHNLLRWGIGIWVAMMIGAVIFYFTWNLGG
ncbi:MAG: hypothetical protein JNK11_10690 [Alphaproteobacteria bacterium]|nr:hypothetical protein [Alphaproteobacteria bacterium]